MKKHFVLLIDLALLVVTIGAVILLLFFGFGNDQVALSPGAEQDAIAILFNFKGVSEISVDDNLEFSSPEFYEVFDGQTIDMNEGVYFWGFESDETIEVRRFEIQTPVVLALSEMPDGSFGVSNPSADLNVVVQRGESELNFLFEGSKDA